VNLFVYSPDATAMHRLDPRFKTAFLFIICISAFLAGPAGLFPLLALIVAALAAARVTLRAALRSLTPFFLLAGIVLLSGVFLGGPGSPLVAGISFMSREGLIRGALGGFRLILFGAAGLSFFSTTTFIQIRETCTRLFKPVPKVPAEHIGLMLGLTLSFVPVVFRLSEQISDARTSRCAASCRKPVRRITGFIMPLVRNIILYAHHVSEAVESRGYTGPRTPQNLKATGRDLMAAAVTSLVCTVSVLLDRVIVPVIFQIELM
jgi:energy-coupling factor transporter transmembrane protein EcfT